MRGEHNHSSVRRAAPVALLGVAFIAGGALLGASGARADGFSLGAFDEYGLLVNNGDNRGHINTSPVDANIGIGNVTAPIDLHNEVVNGQVDCSGDCSSAVLNGNITGTQPASISPTGTAQPASVNSNVANVQAAITAAQSLSSYYGAEAAQGTAVNLSSGSATLNAGSGYLDSTGTRVFTSTTFAPGAGSTITINGAASQFVVIDVTGSSGNFLNSALTLTGGITPDHVLLNFLGSGDTLHDGANGATLQATVLVPNLAIQLAALTIDGHLFGGEAGQNFQFVSDAYIQQPPLTTTPLPAALPLFAAGLGAMVLLGWRRKNDALSSAD